MQSKVTEVQGKACTATVNIIMTDLIGPGEFSFSKTSSVVLIKLNGGEYDIARREELDAELLPAELAAEAVIDFSDVEYVDSTALECLIRLKKKMMKTHPDSRVRLFALKQNVQRVFEITELHRVFEVTSAELPRG